MESRVLNDRGLSKRDQPLLIYDGECGFCSYWAARWKHAVRGAVEFQPFQELEELPGVSEAECRRAVQLVETDGEIFSGAEAVARLLSHSPRSWARLPLWAYENVPGLAPISEELYRLVADHRTAASRLNHLLWGNRFTPPGRAFSSWLFLRALGFIYLIAFISFGVQARGLVGQQGILPVVNMLDAAKAQFGSHAYWQFPTLCWFNSSDPFLMFLCWGGAVLSLLLIAGVATVPVCALLWTFYLSIATAGQEFMEFQWDILLLEAGFLAIFLAPGGFWNGLKLRAPHRIVVWLFGWLVFRLMFESGMVKLVSGDPSWRHFTALSYHYETQPLPTPLAWWFHHAPHGFQTASAVGILAIEVGAPFLILGPRRLRHFACFAFCGLQLLILLTGNYGFFNLLTIALTLTLLDDGFWPESWKARLRAGDDDETLDSGAPAQPRASRWPGPLIWPVAAVIVALSTAGLINVLRIDVDWPEWVQTAYGRAAAFRSVNSYGLFAVMTTDRDEVVVEGSNDGVNWLQYGFKFKPGDPNRAPPFVAPHMPRLDWQMWFAALGDYRQQRWFLRFCGRIMEGSPEVLALLDRNPFGDKPPRYLRAVLYHYAFSDPETSRRNGAWWRREPLRLYAPVMRFAEKPSPPRKPARH